MAQAGTHGLEALLAAAGEGAGARPVESWNPPYCGDIGIAIRNDGTWVYQGSPIGRVGLVKLFASILRKDADGRHYLITPAEKVDVRVEDAPFLAVELGVTGGARPAAHLPHQRRRCGERRCGPSAALHRAEASGGLKPYVLVRGRLEALVTRALYADLVALAVEDRVYSVCGAGASGGRSRRANDQVSLKSVQRGRRRPR